MYVQKLRVEIFTQVVNDDASQKLVNLCVLFQPHAMHGSGRRRERTQEAQRAC